MINDSNRSKEGSITKKIFKPRHGLRMHCEACGFRFNAGGIQTKKHLQQIEKEHLLVHQHVHKQIRRPDERDNPDESLKIERDFHAAEIPHAYQELASTTSQFQTTSTTYVDTGLQVTAANFTANQDHLVIATAQVNLSVNNNLAYIRMMRGTTAIVDSEVAMDPPLATASGVDQRMVYNWWGIVNHTAAEAVKMQIRSAVGTATASVDLATITVIKLSPDLTLNTDYKHTLLSPADTISVSSATVNDLGGDSDPAGNASVSITPSNNNNRWLILSKARYGTGIAGTVAVNSRIERSGGATSSVPEMEQEGENSTAGIILLCGMRVDTLPNIQTHTYTEISRLRNTGGTGSATRTHSAVFMLNLDKFKHVTVNQEDTPAESISTATDYGYLAHSQSISPAQTGDILCMCHMVYFAATSGSDTQFWKMRMQVNNTDALGGTTITTDKAYKFAQWDAQDRLPFLQASIENLTAVAHTVDVDASVGTVATARGTYYRNITLFSMEMAAAAITAVRGETVAINESVVKVLGRQIIKIVNESIGITEGISKFLGTTSDFITPSNFQLRLSGGSSNTNRNLSLGGAMSTVTTNPITITADYDPADYDPDDYNTTDETVQGPTGVLFQGDKLLDDVTISEATSGDPTPDHRCFYILNTHATLTMQGLRVWFAENTPGDDHVQIGLGNSAIGPSTVETAIADEGTPPSPTITFVDAPRRDEALIVGDIPAGHHKAIWIRRTVPAGTKNPVLNNKYTILAEFVTNHI